MLIFWRYFEHLFQMICHIFDIFFNNNIISAMFLCEWYSWIVYGVLNCQNSLILTVFVKGDGQIDFLTFRNWRDFDKFFVVITLFHRAQSTISTDCHPTLIPKHEMTAIESLWFSYFQFFELLGFFTFFDRRERLIFFRREIMNCEKLKWSYDKFASF